MSIFYEADLYKPALGAEGISDPVEAITDDGILCHVIWDGEKWHEIRDSGDETFNRGLKYWRSIPKNWLYDSDYYKTDEMIDEENRRDPETHYERKTGKGS